MEGELRQLEGRLEGARAAGAEGMGPQLQPFVRAAEAELRTAWDALENMHCAAAATLDFFCEDAAPGGLQELCAVLHAFAGRLLAAAQVPAPAPRSAWGRRRLCRPHPAVADVALPRRRTVRGSRRSAGGSSWSRNG